MIVAFIMNKNIDQQFMNTILKQNTQYKINTTFLAMTFPKLSYSERLIHVNTQFIQNSNLKREDVIKDQNECEQYWAIAHKTFLPRL